MNYTFRKAALHELPQIWDILQQAIARRKKDGSNQWQDGYPNPDVITNDIEKGAGYVLLDGEEILGYAALLINDEPAYAGIDGKWLSNGDFVVFHRVAIAEGYLGKGLAAEMFRQIEQFALSNGINSVKADTNFDNPAMLYLFEKMGYTYCGEVFFRGSARKAFEKIINN
ncbi:GCN5 family acetyltransferase [Flavobacterium akiainvivens]|uniref:GCN5 family acetyltransferase n=1 Tax=Flavobacterium akiainvivens TaxID=1202724 RepID=A0A0M9VHX3_9FLAO|nr:GNAT family N-acetyltransferase [Flavobacterium akiainvivens]KOS06050.1 GCN5 family acetyltransferase [Flavobacterium akiainvivens]SFQ54544.1 Acetyltransferase (GNAT) family protein [Flavobacterium akiainvivens]